MTTGLHGTAIPPPLGKSRYRLAPMFPYKGTFLSLSVFLSVFLAVFLASADPSDADGADAQADGAVIRFFYTHWARV